MNLEQNLLLEPWTLDRNHYLDYQIRHKRLNQTKGIKPNIIDETGNTSIDWCIHNSKQA